LKKVLLVHNNEVTRARGNNEEQHTLQSIASTLGQAKNFFFNFNILTKTSKNFSTCLHNTGKWFTSDYAQRFHNFRRDNCRWRWICPAFWQIPMN